MKAKPPDTESRGQVQILKRDSWTCQVCGHTPPEGSDEPMHSVQTCGDETNPDHFETRCSDCQWKHYDDEVASEEQREESVTRATYDPDSLGTRLYRASFAMVVFLPVLLFTAIMIALSITALNPLRIIGVSVWPQSRWDDGAITSQQYLSEVIFEIAPALGLGIVVLVVGTQVSIWIEPKNGFITRLTKWVIRRVRR